ncbi:MAG: tetratricopeptide repeat protein [candidate division Zixibacteria bacterium]|nr:tetratricopeptide repeat protein [candidate division Zixibacteria bacterium]
MKKPKTHKKTALSRKKHKIFWPLLIFALAFLVRFAYLTQIKVSLPSFYAPNMDELYHDILAQNIAFGEGMGSEPFFKGPLYVYLLAYIYKIFGHNYYIPRFLQMIMGSLSCLFVFLIARKLFNRTVGVISGTIAAFYATLIFYDGELMIESLVIFLDLVLIYLLVSLSDKSSLKRWLGCGAVLGLSAIARPNVLIFAPFVLLWMFLGFKDKLKSKAILSRWAIFCLGVLLLVFPVTLRNLVVGKDLVLIGWQGGHNFYLGNNPEASGWSVTAAQIDVTWWGGYHDAMRVAQQETGRQLKPSQISRFWYNKGLDFIMTSPFRWIKLMVNKVIYFWKGFEIPNDKNFYFYKNFSSLFNLLLTKSPLYLPFGLIGPLSILGMAVGLKKWRKYLLLYLFILSYTISVVIFFVCSRFRMPVIPFLIIFSAFFIWWLVDRIKHKKLSPLLVSVPALLVLVAFLNTGRGKIISETEQNAQDRFILATTYERLGKLREAVREYQTALEFNPEFASAYNNLGIIYGKTGMPQLAVEHFRRAIRFDPNYAKAYFNLGVIYQQTDSLDQAEEAYLKALQISPEYEAARLSLGKVYFRKGMKDKAREEWERVLQLNPNNDEAKRCLQLK